MLERQAWRALERTLRSGEVVRGFTLCEYDNGRPTLQVFAGRARSKGFFAISDDRLFLIPLRVRDLMAFNFTDVEDVRLPLDELLTVSFGGNFALGMTVNDPDIGHAVMRRFQQLLAQGRETFERVFRTSAFEQSVNADMARCLAAGLSHADSVSQVGWNHVREVRSRGGDKFVGGAAAHAAVEIAERYQPTRPVVAQARRGATPPR